MKKTIKLLIGGSPCTRWSIAQKNNRETEASGIGWELFKNYLIVKEKFKPDYFLYENNKSAAQPIKDQIAKELGYPLQYINSALVSAQNRQRFYVHNIPNVPQPEDRGILLRDILNSEISMNEKSYCLDACYYKGGNLSSFEKQSGKRLQVAEPVCVNSKSGDRYDKRKQPSLADRIYDINAKSTACTTGFITKIAEPVCVAERGRLNDGEWEQKFEAREDNKTNALTTVSKDNNIAELIRIPEYGNSDKSRPINALYPNNCGGWINRINNLNPNKQQIDIICEPVCIGHIESVTINAGGGGQGGKTGLYACPISETINGKSHTIKAQYYKNGIANFISNDGFDASAVAEPLIIKEATKQGYVEINQGECVDLTQPNSKTRRGRKMSDKCNCLTTSNEYYQYIGTKNIYEVKNGLITIKDKQYPIKLIDGYYIIRKLTVNECRRLQTIPDWYEMPYSDSQNYKMLGNGWTVEVIKHILSYIPNYQDYDFEVLSMYDGMACGYITLKELGINVIKYVSYEIDKYAIITSSHNFPDIIQRGDAFQVRDSDWEF